MFRKIFLTLTIGIVCAVGFTSYAFTASNTVPVSSAGDGSGVVSGYTVSGVGYTLNGTTPTNIDVVTFTIAPIAAGTVKVKANGNWYACTNTAGAISCDTDAAPGPQLTVAPTSTLEVLAIQ